MISLPISIHLTQQGGEKTSQQGSQCSADQKMGFRANQCRRAPVLIIPTADSDRWQGQSCRWPTNRRAPSSFWRLVVGALGGCAGGGGGGGPPVESLLGPRNQVEGALSVCRVEWCRPLLCVSETIRSGLDCSDSGLAASLLGWPRPSSSSHQCRRSSPR